MWRRTTNDFPSNSVSTPCIMPPFALPQLTHEAYEPIERVLLHVDTLGEELDDPRLLRGPAPEPGTHDP